MARDKLLELERAFQLITDRIHNELEPLRADIQLLHRDLTDPEEHQIISQILNKAEALINVTHPNALFTVMTMPDVTVVTIARLNLD